MKKLVFGCALMLCGAICGTGWLVAFCSACVEPSAWSTVLNFFPIIGFGRADSYIVILFYMLAIIGAVIAVKELKKD